MQVTIYDGNNWFFRSKDRHFHGVVRGCYDEIQNSNRFPIIVWDGYNSLSARRDLYPDYKGNRESKGDDHYASQNLLMELLHLGKGISIRMPNVEADDVIAHLTQTMMTEHDIYIESNDGDFAQLGVPMAYEYLKMDPEWITTFKTLVGDSSDNIKGAKGFGKGAWANLSESDMAAFRTMFKTGNFRPDLIELMPITKMAKNWLVEPANFKQLEIYFQVVNFIPLTQEQIDEHTIQHELNPAKAEQLMGKYEL